MKEGPNPYKESMMETGGNETIWRVEPHWTRISLGQHGENWYMARVV